MKRRGGAIVDIRVKETYSGGGTVDMLNIRMLRWAGRHVIVSNGCRNKARMTFVQGYGMPCFADAYDARTLYAHRYDE